MSPSPISTGAPPTAIPSALPSPNLAPIRLESAASTPRASVSQEDLTRGANISGLAATATRRARWHAQRAGNDTLQGQVGSATETALVVNPYEKVAEALVMFQQHFSSLFPDWSVAVPTQSPPPLSLDDVRPRIESNLDRIGSFSRGQDGTSKVTHAATSHWESTRSQMETLQKIDGWLKKTSHPLLPHVLYWLWRGVGAIFDYLTSAEHLVGGFSRGSLDQFSRTLQELSVVLPSSLYHVSKKEDLLESQVQAATAYIYADILELVGSIVQDVFIPAKPHAGSSSNTGGIRQTLIGKARDHSHHFGGRHSSQGMSINTNVAVATGSAPASPTGTAAAKKQVAVSQWKSHLRKVMEQIGYHSILLRDALHRLQAQEQSGRFGKISTLLNEVEHAERMEKDFRKALQSMGSRVEQPQRRGSDSSGSSEGVNDNTNEEFIDDRAGMEAKKAELEAQRNAARRKKEKAFAELREEAGHIKCDVCLYTGYEETQGYDKDFEVVLRENLREFTDMINTEASASTGKSSSPENTIQRKSLFKIYVTNESTIEILGAIDPQFMLSSRGRKALDECPNLWSFAMLDRVQKPGWSYIKTTLPNLEQGYGAESKRYPMEVRDETAYFYDTTWKIYWCQPSPQKTNACPVAILVLSGNDIPVSRPIDSSPKAQADMQKARYDLIAHYRQQFHVPLLGATIHADNLAVQILAETKRRWREVLDKFRHFVDVLTTRLYDEASNFSIISNMGPAGQRQAAEAVAAYNVAAAQVFKILIRINTYESMFIETMSNIGQLADRDILMGSGSSKLDLLQFHDDDDDYFMDDTGEQRGTRFPYSRSNTRSLSRSGLLRSGGPVRGVSWRDVARGHQDLLDFLKSTKRQADSLKGMIDHQHSMYESRVSNQLAVIANWHAAEASRQADEAAAQNASMRRLTVVTFVFLPLTFIASLFGTNVTELGQGPVKIWVFFAVGIPFAAFVLGAWAYLEFWKQNTKSEGKGGELSGRSRVEEIELLLQRQGGLADDDDEDNVVPGMRRGPWVGGERMV